MSGFSAEERVKLGRVADLLIPATSVMPSGAMADAHGAHIDRVVRVRPDLVDSVRQALRHVPDPLPRSLESLDPQVLSLMRPVADAITAAYFVNPEVARLVGYQKRSLIPIHFDEDLDTLVSTVTARGPIYRPTPVIEEH